MRGSTHIDIDCLGALTYRWTCDLPGRCLPGAVILALILAVPIPAAQVRVSQGMLVRLKLHYDLTTENVQKGDKVDFDVAEDVKVGNYVVIPRGAAALGEVVGVKGAGKKNAKDAAVTFRLMAVRTSDNQEIPIRVIPTKTKKSNPKEEEIEVNSPIPGLRERMIGAQKGKEFAAYTDRDSLVNAPEPAAGAAPDAGAQPAPAAGATAAPTNPAGLMGLDPASVNFISDPSGADILIDGGSVGSTPSTLRVAAGRHTIALRMAGYRTWNRNMMVGPGSTPSIRATLEKE